MRLLISVRNAEEARRALAGGADWIDVKEPLNGSLGRAEPGSIEDVARTVKPSIPLSVALGELRDQSSESYALPPGVQFAKCGLAGALDLADWKSEWRQAMDRLPASVRPVVVAYADWRTCRAPRPNQVVSLGRDACAPFILVDTFDKSQGGLLDHVTLPDLAHFIRGVKRQGMQIALAGGLDLATIRQLLPLKPDVIAVRTAVCADGRTGEVATGRVLELKKTLAEWRPALQLQAGS